MPRLRGDAHHGVAAGQIRSFLGFSRSRPCAPESTRLILADGEVGRVPRAPADAADRAPWPRSRYSGSGTSDDERRTEGLSQPAARPAGVSSRSRGHTDSAFHIVSVMKCRSAWQLPRRAIS